MAFSKTKGWAKILESMFKEYKNIPIEKRGIPVVGVFVEHNTKKVIGKIFVTSNQTTGGKHAEMNMIDHLPDKPFDLFVTLSPCRECYIKLNQIMEKNINFKKCLFLMENTWSEKNKFENFNTNINFLSLFTINNSNTEQIQAISSYDELHKFSIEIIKHQNSWIKRRAQKKGKDKFKYIKYNKKELKSTWEYKSLSKKNI